MHYKPMIKAVSKTSSIKRAQKESTILRLVASLLNEAARDIPRFQSIVVNRVCLSPGKSMCRVYIYMPEGKDHFATTLQELKLYKPSLRKALAQSLDGRYTADIMFVFDEQLDKTLRIESLLDSIKEDVIGSDQTD